MHGAGIAFSGKVMTGYNAGAAPYQYVTGWFPNGTEVVPHFANATDAIQQGVRELLRNTEVIGGDLLMKRAHQAFISGTHPVPTEISPDFTDLIKLSGDLSVAQDYQNYLNNREAINALIAANPDTAFAAGWIATFARVNDLKLNQVSGSDFLGGLVGYLDSVDKAGLGAAAENASVRRGAGNSVIVEVKVANGAEVPGSLSVFADHVNIASDASGQTVQFTVDGGLAARGYNGLGAGASEGDGLNDLWIGSVGATHTFTGTGGHDILVGGSMNDVIYGGAGWDFIEGGIGNDYLFGQDGGDLLRGGRGTDFLYGSSGNDTYGFARGDGVDRVFDDTSDTVFVGDPNGMPGSGHYEVRQIDAGSDTLAFGPGIAVSDIAMAFTEEGLVVVVKDPAHPGVSFWEITDRITLQGWGNPNGFNAIETLAFADGTTLDIGASLGTYLVPFGETLSRSSVAENSAVGTVVGTVTASDLDAADVLTYSLRDDVTGGRFAINASSGAITVTGSLNFEGTNAWPIVVRVADQAGHVYDHAFVINVTNVNEAPAGIALAGGSVPEHSPGGTVAGTASASDPDAGTVFRYSLLDDAGGRFYISPTSGVIVNVSSQTINYEGTPAWPIMVRAADQYGQVVDRPFVINITNVNETSTDITLSGSSVAENATIGTVIGTAHGNDPDAGTSLSYSLTGDVTGGRFAVNASTGAISVAGPLNFEGTPAWPVTVRAADQAGNAFAKSFVINVTNVNEAPTGITLSGNSIVENSPGGTIVGTAHGVDPDAGTVFSYALLDDAGGRFFIYPTSGIIVNVSSQTIDYEAAHSHAITVRATDQNGLAFDKSFAIALGNVNDNAPAVSAAANVTASPGQTLAASSLFSAGDPDGDALTTFIYDWSPAANSGHFVVNGSVVPAETVVGLTPSDLAHTSFVAGFLGAADDLGVMAFDGVHYSGNTSFNPVQVTAVNHAPVVSVPQTSVTAAAGQVFAASSLFGASDADGDALTWFIYDWTPAAGSGHFVVNGAVVPAETVVGLTPFDFAHTSFVAGSPGSNDALGVMAFDGHDYSGNTSFNGFHVLV